MEKFNSISVGDPAPWFIQRSSTLPNFHFHAAGGRYVVMCFFGSSADPIAADCLKVAFGHRHLFDDQNTLFFGISTDPEDESTSRVVNSYPGLRYFWDVDGTVSKLYGSLPQNTDSKTVNSGAFRRQWVILDPTLRVVKIVPISDAADNGREVMKYVEALPWPVKMSGLDVQAPIVVLPNLFDPELCQDLINLYESNGGSSSGFMREENGKTVLVNDSRHKTRRDFIIEDEQLIAHLKSLFRRRAIPEIKKVFQFGVTRMERHLVVCYDVEDGGHFNPHRDNTTKGTAYRQFAVSVNLNDDYDGGEISFPEYGPRSYKPSPGGAVIFSCSLLHAVSTVTRGKRYAFLPFLYNDESAKLREKNSRFLGEGLEPYQFRPQT